MVHVAVEVECPLRSSFRVEQIAGMFDVPLKDKLTERFEVELPDDEEVWDIGLIVGPSGSGKSTIARRHYGAAPGRRGDWPSGRAVVDAFDPLPIKQTVDLLTAVGFGSPPSWIKPYEVLSEGERFRCDLARALAVGCMHDAATEHLPRERPLVVFDEFTSTVDRNVARFGSAAVAKAIRSERVRARFIAVTCHYDVEPWLEPDWTLDMASGKLERRRLRRPEIRLEVRRCALDTWRLFARHHYLNGGLSWGARCYLATWNGTPTAPGAVPVAICAVLPMFATRGRWRITRLVTLPDYQGLGIGTRLAEAVGDLYLAEGLRFGITSAHPALLAHCRRSPRWRLSRVVRCGSRHRDRKISDYRSAAGRATASFELLPVQEVGE